MAKSEVPEKAIELIEELYCLCLPWRLAEIRAEAFREACDILMQVPCVNDNETEIRREDAIAAILAGEVRLPLPPEVLMDARQDTMHVDTGARRSVKAIRAALGNED